MHLLPASALEILEFDRVRDAIKGYCTGTIARERCSDIAPSSDLDWIALQLDTVVDALAIHEEGLSLFSAGYHVITDYLDKLRVEGYVLGGEEVLNILSVLERVDDITKFFKGDRKTRYPYLGRLADGLMDTSAYIREIRKVLDDEGEVKPDASPVLVSISRQLQSKRDQGDRVFQKTLRKYISSGMLADNRESIRNGRRVLAVLSEHKRKIRGILHDQSASGKTTFIEPEEMIGINNELFDLHASYRAEQRRILAGLCDLLRPDCEQFAICQEIVVETDLYLAKGRHARSIVAQRPEIAQEPHLSLRNARHPLLYLKNQAAGKETVPFDLVLANDNRILLLSGPNAGGKSILMKSVGLLQVMFQSGLLVSADAQSEFGVFQRLCVELGDMQSIDDDLSTYSSRLLDMKEFISHADSSTLVLIDEFGSGTDPKLGGAIAEAILEELRKKEVHGVLTTHYPELKAYAYKTSGIVNGAMIFDNITMSPSYLLRVGKPGSSFAFEIAERTGFPREILEYARKNAGRNEKALEDLLVDLETQKGIVEKQRANLDQKEQQLDKLVSNYERMQTELTAQRKKMRLEQKERDYQHLSQLNKELEQEIRKIREQKDLETAKSNLRKLKSVRAETREDIRKINADLEEVIPDDSRDLQEGDYVRLPNSQQTGRIERIDKNNATVIVGHIRMDLPVRRLVSANAPIAVNPTTSVTRDLVHLSSQFNPMLDIRGMRANDAGQLVQKFLDDAMLVGATPVRIVHGKGSGVLRRLVEQKLREYPVTVIQQPEDQQGGSGVTVIEF